MVCSVSHESKNKRLTSLCSHQQQSAACILQAAAAALPP